MDLLELKKCARCGAKNRDRFEFCVRCSEALLPGRSSTARVPSVGRAPLALAAVGAVALGAVVFRMMATGGREPDRPAPADPVSQEPTAPARPAAAHPDLEEASAATREGKSAFQAGDYETALRHFQELARFSPDNAVAYLYIGLCQRELGRPDDAVQSLRRAVDLQPGNDLARKALIHLLTTAGRLEDAAELQAWWVERQPFAAEPLIDLGRIHRQQGNLDRAIEMHRSAVEKASPAVQERALLELGATLNEAKRSEEAIEVFGQIIEGNPGHAAARAGLGTALLVSGRYAEAAEALERAVADDPAQPQARLHLAMTYEQMNRIEDSLREYESFLKLSPHHPNAPRIAELVRRAQAALEERKTR